MYFDHKKPDVMNWRLLDGSTFIGRYDMPKLMPVEPVSPKNMVPFNQIGIAKDKENSWFHFYVDDYRLERMWRTPEKYLPKLLEYAGGIGLDFSLFLDQPRGQMVYNAWRNYTLTYWLQREANKRGKIIFPNACFAGPDSLDWVFEPLPENSALAITTQGCMQNRICKQSLVNGLHELIRQKHPSINLLLYSGGAPVNLIRIALSEVTEFTEGPADYLQCFRVNDNASCLLNNRISEVTLNPVVQNRQSAILLRLDTLCQQFIPPIWMGFHVLANIGMFVRCLSPPSSQIAG